MKKNHQVNRKLASFLLLIATATLLHAQQAFRRGSLLVGVTEGSTRANYTTKDAGGNNYTRCINGTRDPLSIEYGISKRWGLGLTSGTDIFMINPTQFYGFKVSGNQVKATTAEFTVDGNYHVFVNKRLDLSLFASLGAFSVSMKGTDSDRSYKYNTAGNIIRVGTKARYYFFKRLGVLGMLSSYSASCSPQGVKGNTVGTNYATRLNGFAVEMGLCFRILR